MHTLHYTFDHLLQSYKKIDTITNLRVGIVGGFNPQRVGVEPPPPSSCVQTLIFE